MNPVRFDIFLETYAGHKFRPDRLALNEYCIEDIAHSLSMQCRYNGHCDAFYSVAEHSILIQNALEREGYDSLTQLQGLLHDATEAYVGDLPTPIKDCIPGFKEFENTLEPFIFDMLDTPYPINPVIKKFDRLIIANERNQLFSDAAHAHWVVGEQLTMPSLTTPDARVPVRVHKWSPSTARECFLYTYSALKNALKNKDV